MTNIATDNGHLEWIYPLNIEIFHSYVSFPEGRVNSCWIVNNPSWQMVNDNALKLYKWEYGELYTVCACHLFPKMVDIYFMVIWQGQNDFLNSQDFLG